MHDQEMSMSRIRSTRVMSLSMVSWNAHHCTPPMNSTFTICVVLLNLWILLPRKLNSSQLWNVYGDVRCFMSFCLIKQYKRWAKLLSCWLMIDLGHGSKGTHCLSFNWGGSGNTFSGGGERGRMRPLLGNQKLLSLIQYACAMCIKWVENWHIDWGWLRGPNTFVCSVTSTFKCIQKGLDTKKWKTKFKSS